VRHKADPEAENISDLLRAGMITSQPDQYRLAADGDELSAEPAGTLSHRAPTRAAMPVVGDWVEAHTVGEGQAIVEAVLPADAVFAARSLLE
jgi:hypothetical protein